MITNRIKSFGTRTLLVLAMLFIFNTTLFARVGGAGGHSSGGSHSSGSSHSSGGGYSHSYSSDDGYSSGSSSSGGGGSIGGGTFALIFVVVVIIIIIKASSAKKVGNNVYSGTDDDGPVMPSLPAQPFPDGLTKEKVYTAFMELQKAWQVQDLRRVRRWMSDGVYQRFTVQFAMMKKLSQHNTLSNIQVLNISPVGIRADGTYQSADVAISFRMDDSFTSEAYPELDDEYEGEQAMEYWTFIKRADAVAATKDLYHTENCPNCGAQLEDMMGEVSRCQSCKTLVNNASYDWVLSEITQADDYHSSEEVHNAPRLAELTKNDKLFSVQRMEDIASNIFMQTMEVMTGADNKKLSRFADPSVAEQIISAKKRSGNFVFDRLYLNEVTLKRFEEEGEMLHLLFRLTATYQRVRPGAELEDLDDDMNTHQFFITLSRKAASLNATAKDFSFSYECANCGAPYTDTTEDFCSYCDAPVIDTARNWVLTDFKGLEAV